MVSRKHQVKVGLMGLGVIGGGVARVLTQKADAFSKQLDAPLVLSRVLERDLPKADALSLDRALVTSDGEDFFAEPNFDIVIELLGGEKPAYEYIKWALEMGRYVVTANKEVMAKHGPELLALARKKGVDILYEASVGGGIPIIAPLKRDLLANDITAISAIINGTTNYILTRMSQRGAGLRRCPPTGPVPRLRGSRPDQRHRRDRRHLQARHTGQPRLPHRGHAG